LQTPPFVSIAPDTFPSDGKGFQLPRSARHGAAPNARRCLPAVVRQENGASLEGYWHQVGHPALGTDRELEYQKERPRAETIPAVLLLSTASGGAMD
jgi:hypothetical protein